ncbi:alpha/beta hydrolase [Lysobacter sp. K5869]|uniref:alpha/beta hydrolase family protein n=1 Tax=Lysobacter sp. K5869 TaxID=2820808 RepID=UPI001C05EE8A|nr:alpha/beta fold hydrolase [Lysobacter sp. K5869]QWP77074.1 alpha/beta hydrolase [Lysobacter sp. K5869]
MKLKLLAPLALIAPLFAPAAANAAARYVASESQRVAIQPSAAVRDAEGSNRLRVTVWYPAGAGSAAREVVLGPPDAPFFRVASLADDAPLADDTKGRKRPVILLSHGFGGSARMMGWFAAPLAQAGYVVIGVDHPGNNGADRMTVPGAILWWERAEDLKRALDTVTADPQFGPHIDASRVGASGFSAGGFTALALAGARFDRQRLLGFCHAHPDDGVCRPQLEFAITEDDMRKALQRPEVAALEAGAGADHSLPAVKAVFAMAPALVQAFTPESLQRIDVPVRIVSGEADTVAALDSNARIAAEAIPGAHLTALPEVGHYAFLSECTPAGREKLAICAQTGPQASAHEVAVEQALKLFRRALGKP